MRFFIGPWTYMLRIINVEDQPLLDDKGAELLGQAHYGHREILIDSTVLPENRLDILLHELKHCWLFHFPKPRTEEEVCNFFSACTTQAMRDLDSQGGLPSLMRLKPEVFVDMLDEIPFGTPTATPAGHTEMVPCAYVEDVDTVATPEGRRGQCGSCGMSFSGGQIVYTKGKFNRIVGGMTSTGSLFCPHCDHVQEWDEGVDANGRPNGAVAAGPRFLSGSAAHDFLRAHPEAAGIIVA